MDSPNFAGASPDDFKPSGDEEITEMVKKILDDPGSNVSMATVVHHWRVTGKLPSKDNFDDAIRAMQQLPTDDIASILALCSRLTTLVLIAEKRHV